MQVVPTAEVERLLPHCRRDGLSKGALWQDAFMPKPHRVIAELLHWAESTGAVVCNRTELLSARREADGKWRASIHDHDSNQTAEVGTRWIINATGAASDEVIRRMVGRECDHVLVPTMAWGLLIDRPPVSECSVAVAPPGKGQRTYFVHPYRGRVLAGTGHAGIPAGTALPSGVSDAQVGATLADLNAALPGAAFARDQVRHVFWGVLPGVTRGSDALLMHPQIIDHGKRDGMAGAWTVLGVKFTEAPFVANRVWNGLLGAEMQSLPQRPAPVAVPSIEDARRMSDQQLQSAMKALASVEWRASPADLVWRRTDLWMDESVAQRVTGKAGASDLP